MTVLKVSTKNIQKVFDRLKLKNKKFFELVRKSWAKDGKVLIQRLVKKQYSGRPGLKQLTGNTARGFLSKTSRVGTNVTQKIFFSANNAAKKYVFMHDVSRKGGGFIHAKRSPYLIFKTEQSGWVKTRKVFIPVRTDVLGFLGREGRRMRIKSLNDAIKVFQ